MLCGEYNLPKRVIWFAVTLKNQLRKYIKRLKSAEGKAQKHKGIN
jgi:hypothetical protein